MLIQVSDTVRVESGPRRKKAKATEALLRDDVTAPHYQVDKKDALGKPIKIGEDMNYLDWLGTPVWYVYELKEDPTGRPRYVPVGDPHETREAAVAAAQALT